MINCCCQQSRLQAGPYEAASDEWAWTVLERLVEGQVEDTTVTVIEGLWMTEIADEVAPLVGGGADSFDLPYLCARGCGVFVGAAAMLLNPSGVPTPGGNWWGEDGTVSGTYGNGAVNATDSAPLDLADGILVLPDRAGIDPGDVIVAVDGRRVSADRPVPALLVNRAGRVVSLTLTRSATEKPHEVTVAAPAVNDKLAQQWGGTLCDGGPSPEDHAANGRLGSSSRGRCQEAV